MNKGKISNEYDLSGLVKRLQELEPEFREVPQAKPARRREVERPGVRHRRPNRLNTVRGVAQPDRAPVSYMLVSAATCQYGQGGRRFNSCRRVQFFSEINRIIT